MAIQVNLSLHRSVVAYTREMDINSNHQWTAAILGRMSSRCQVSQKHHATDGCYQSIGNTQRVSMSCFFIDPTCIDTWRHWKEPFGLCEIPCQFIQPSSSIDTDSRKSRQTTHSTFLRSLRCDACRRQEK